MNARQAFATHEASLFDNLQDGQRQLLVRPINESIIRAHDDAEPGQEVAIICECVNPACRERVSVTRRDYEEVRRFPTRFILRLEHLREASERLVERRSGFSVVEKVGPGAEDAILTDPRRH